MSSEVRVEASAQPDVPSVRGRKRRRVQRPPAPASALLLACRHATSNSRLLHVLKSASDAEWKLRQSPIVKAVLIAQASATKKLGVKPSQSALVVRIVEMCAARRTESVDLLHAGYEIAGTRWEIPIVAAAQYSLTDVVRAILDNGGLPDICNSDGATVWHAAFSNPSSGPGNTMRRCDVDVVRLLLSRGLVVSDLKTWHNAEPGTRIFTGCEDNCYVTVLAATIFKKNMRAVELAVASGARLSDMDFWRIYMDRKARREHTKLLPVVVHVSAALGRSSLRSGNMFDMRTAQTWDSALDWSFPPHWRNSMVALALCLGRRVHG